MLMYLPLLKKVGGMKCKREGRLSGRFWLPSLQSIVKGFAAIEYSQVYLKNKPVARIRPKVRTETNTSFFYETVVYKKVLLDYSKS